MPIVDLPVARFAYDGLGRLIKKNYRLGVAGESSALGFANYIYDGARRVQEILRYPVAAAALLWPAAADRPPLHGHPECAAGGGCPPGYATQHVIEHEYVWSPDGGDSIVAAITPDDLYGFDDDGPPAGAGLPSVTGSGDDDVYYMLQDDNGNVMSVVDEAGAVRVQYQYDPYGELVIRDVPLPGALPLPGPTAKSPLFSVGFQGLFFERFYGLLVESAGGGQRSNVNDPRLDVPAPVSAAGGNGGAGGVGSASQSTQVRGLYYMRNRWYSAHDGRFTSRDPNEAGMPIIAALAANGETLGAAISGFSATGQYSDGMNLYGFVHGNPVNRVDSLGLYSAEDEYETDRLIGELSGARIGALAAAAGKVGKSVNTGLLIAQVALSLIPGYDAVKLGVMLAFNPAEVTAMDYVSAALSAGGGTVALAGVKFASKQIARAASRFGLGWLAANGDNIASAAAKLGAACQRLKPLWCLAAGTLVDTQAGLTPIEAIRPGSMVLTADEFPPRQTCYRRVTDVYCRVSPLLGTIVLDDGVQIEATSDHTFWNQTANTWTRLDQMANGDLVVDPSGRARSIVHIEYGVRSVLVYNLEVESTHTFYANGILVHNCQVHHLISMKIHRALEKHPFLQGKFKYRDDRYKLTAANEEAHRGYQTWHRELDKEVQTG